MGFGEDPAQESFAHAKASVVGTFVNVREEGEG